MRTLLFFLILMFSIPSLAKVKLSFEGEIDSDSLASLEKRILKEAGKMKPDSDRIIEITLDSGGGDLLKTFASVRRIRAFESSLNIRIHTRVWSNCESSCTVLYTAGSIRTAGRWAKFGFHSPKIASKVPANLSRTQIIEDARIRWISAISEVDSQLGVELERRGLLLRDRMTYLRSRDLLHGYVGKID